MEGSLIPPEKQNKQNLCEDDTSSQERGHQGVKALPPGGCSMEPSGAITAATWQPNEATSDLGIGLADTKVPNGVESVDQAIDSVVEPAGTCASLDLASHEAQDNYLRTLEDSGSKAVLGNRSNPIGAWSSKESLTSSYYSSPDETVSVQGKSYARSRIRRFGEKKNPAREFLDKMYQESCLLLESNQEMNSTSTATLRFLMSTMQKLWGTVDLAEHINRELRAGVDSALDIVRYQDKVDDQHGEARQTEIRTKSFLCEVVALNIRELASLFKVYGKPAREGSYKEIINKLECAELIFKTHEPFNDRPSLEEKGLDDHTCELTYRAAQELDPEAKWEDIFKSTPLVRSCRLRALSGLSLYYSRTGAEPDWELLARIWHEAKLTKVEEHSTTLLETIRGARTNLLNGLEINKTTSLINKTAKSELPSLSGEFQSAQAAEAASKKCSLCPMKFNLGPLGDRSYRQWIHLNYQVAGTTLHEFCKQNSLSAENQKRNLLNVEFPTHEAKITTHEVIAGVIPSLVSNAINSCITPKKGKTIRNAYRCPHDLDHWSRAWADAQGALNPTFSAMVFIGEPFKENQNPIIMINEEVVYKWTKELVDRERKIDYGPSSPGVLLDPIMLRYCSSVISTKGTHSLKIHSTGSSSHLCSQRPHETRRWIDNKLPLEVETCQLGKTTFS